MSEQSIAFLHKLNDGGLLYLNHYLERKCGCSVFHISPTNRLIYDGDRLEEAKLLKKRVLQNVQDKNYSYDAENACMVYRYRVNEYRNLFVFFPVTEEQTDRILDEIGQIAPSKWFLHRGLEQRLPELEKRYSPLNRYESERSGYLFSTLRELVRSQFNYQEAAHHLHVHLNTLYYRQEKLSDLLSLDLTDLETKIILYHELFAYDFEQFLHTAKEQGRD